MSPDRALLQKAVRLLGRRAHSRLELARKLQRSADADAIAEVLDRLETLGYLDDAEYARQRAASGRRRNWSNRRIRGKLKAGGVSDQIIAATLEGLDADAPESEALHRLAGRWMARRGRPRTAGDLKKLFDACARAGYPPALVREELGGLFDDIEWD